ERRSVATVAPRERSTSCRRRAGRRSGRRVSTGPLRSVDDVSGVWRRHARGARALSLPAVWLARQLLRRPVLTTSPPLYPTRAHRGAFMVASSLRHVVRVRGARRDVVSRQRVVLWRSTWAGDN